MLKPTAKVTRKGKGGRRLMALVKSMKAGPNAVHVGLPASEVERSIIEIAGWNEWGTRTIPARPALRNATKAMRAQGKAQLQGIAKQMIAAATREGRGVQSVSSIKRKGLSKIGIALQGRMQAEIVGLRNPANAASTIKAKGSSNPLISSGAYRQAITYVVKD